MKIVIRYFFRSVRLVLTPVVLTYEKLSTPKAIARSPAEQAIVDQAAERLALYQFRACPFCMKVRKEMQRLGLAAVEIRDAQYDGTHRAALQAGGGRVKVPCLLIRHEDDREEWLYDSDTITSRLQSQLAALDLST